MQAKTLRKISVYIIAFNEAEKISQTIASVRWADEVVVVDSWSTDGTTEIATNMGARVVHVKFNGYGDLRSHAVRACTHEWIFSLDSDERCTRQAANEIVALINSEDAMDAYWTPRRNFFMGRWIRYSGWYPNYRQPQLFRKGSLEYDNKTVHEGFVVHSKKPIGHMKSAIWQYPFKDMAQVLYKANRYSSLGASKVLHKKISMWSALGHGVWSFLKHYVFKLGFLDGWAGFMIAFGNFEGTFYRYVKALEIQKGAQWAPPAFKDSVR